MGYLKSVSDTLISFLRFVLYSMVFCRQYVGINISFCLGIKVRTFWSCTCTQARHDHSVFTFYSRCLGSREFTETKVHPFLKKRPACISIYLLFNFWRSCHYQFETRSWLVMSVWLWWLMVSPRERGAMRP